MASSPAFSATPKHWGANIIAAGGVTSPTGGSAMTTTSRSGVSSSAPTNAVQLLSAGASGSRIDEITFTSLGTSTANVARIFVLEGTVTYLYREIYIPAVTAAAGTPVAQVITEFTNFVIESGGSVWVSVATIDSNYSVTAFGGDF